MFTKEEKYLLIEAINHAISYRIKNGTRRGEIRKLVEARDKIKEYKDEM